MSRRATGILAGLAVLIAAVAAAMATGSQVGSINGGVESAATASGTWIGQLATTIPFGYAFGAGMVAAVNPCGFALLPAYIALYLGDMGEQSTGGIGSRLVQALVVSGAMTVAFILVFGAAGVVLSAAASALVPFLPVIGLAVGLLLIVTGGRMLGGSTVYHSLGERIAGRLGAQAQARTAQGYFAYGLAYAAASLSCVLPIFLGVVAGALAAGGVITAIVEFVLYALGMGLVIALLTASAAFVKYGALTRVRGIVRFVEPLSAVLLLLAGGYIVYYWLTLGGVLAMAGIRA